MNSQQEPISGGAIAINVPLLEKDSAEDVQKLLLKTKKGLWVGLNRFENAGIAAVQLLGIHNEKFLKELAEHRKKGSEKVIAADAAEAKKWD